MLTINNKKEKIVELLEGMLKGDNLILGREEVQEGRLIHYNYKYEENGIYPTHEKFDFHFSINRNFFDTLNFDFININGETFSDFFEWYRVEDEKIDIMIEYLKFIKENL